MVVCEAKLNPFRNVNLSVHARKRLILVENCKRVREFFQIHTRNIWIILIQLLQLIWSRALYLELLLRIPQVLLIFHKVQD